MPSFAAISSVGGPPYEQEFPILLLKKRLDFTQNFPLHGGVLMEENIKLPTFAEAPSYNNALHTHNIPARRHP